MLRLLSITNFATIERLEMDLAGGLSVLTGETGAGKSIIVDALSLLLGGRADSGMVRAGTRQARVEGIFLLTQPVRERIAVVLGEEAADVTDEELILAREVNTDGRNTCRVGGRLVPLRLLAAVGEQLVDIHGQSQHLSLLRAPEQLQILDRYGSLESQRGAVSAQLTELREVRQRLAELQRSEQERARQMDLLRYQVQEIAQADLRPDEDRQLAAERSVLNNVERLLGLANQAYAALQGNDDPGVSGVDLLSRVAEEMAQIERLDPSLREPRQTAELLASQAQELAQTLRRYRDGLEYSPQRLQEIEERLDVVAGLKRKYGDDIQEVLAFARQAATELDELAHSQERRDDLLVREAALLLQAGESAGRLSSARREAAELLARAVEGELVELAMEGARMEVEVRQAESEDGLPVHDAQEADPSADGGPRRLAFDSTGVDRVQFLIAPNAGEPPRPLAKIASGGEISRLMLAVKSILSAADEVPTLVFDEIDAGIGGRVGTVVGRKLWGLSARHQVICVTHQPQIASLADHHIGVAKSTMDGRAVTSAASLTGDSRVHELHQMLGAVGEAARLSAREMLEQAEEWKRSARG